jgi:hypothetical protein
VKSTNNSRERGLSRKPRKYAASVAWSDAVDIAGGEEVLTRDVPRGTWTDWRRRDKVPAYALLPHILRRVQTRELHQERTRQVREEQDAAEPEQALLSITDAMLDPDFMDAVRKLHRIWARRKTAEGVDTWRAIRQNLSVFARHVDAPAPGAAAARAGDRKRQHEPS